MNPFFERRWRDAHTRLITYLSDALQERLPPDLIIGAEEDTIAVSVGEKPATYRPDVQIREPWELKDAAPATAPPPPSAPVATQPIRVLGDDEIERWLEIRDVAGRLITVIELLSPSNKLESTDRDRYLAKRRAFIGGASVVEIDLVRRGAWLLPQAVQSVLRQAAACYGVCVFRASRPGEHEVYPIRLRDKLPNVGIPLRPTDADVVCELQPLIDQCHERGRYHLLDYRLPLDPPLAPEDATWAGQRLRQSGLWTPIAS